MNHIHRQLNLITVTLTLNGQKLYRPFKCVVMSEGIKCSFGYLVNVVWFPVPLLKQLCDKSICITLLVGNNTSWYNSCTVVDSLNYCVSTLERSDVLHQLWNFTFLHSTDIKIIWRKRERKKMLLGKSDERAFEPKFVPQGDVEERTAVAHHRRTLWAWKQSPGNKI